MSKRITTIKVPAEGQAAIFLTFRTTASGSIGVDVHASGDAKEINSAAALGPEENVVHKMDSAGRRWTEARAANLAKARAARLEKIAARKNGAEKPKRSKIHDPKVCKCLQLKPKSVLRQMLHKRVSLDQLARAIGTGKTNLYFKLPMNGTLPKAKVSREHAKLIAAVLSTKPSSITEPFAQPHKNHTY